MTIKFFKRLLKLKIAFSFMLYAGFFGLFYSETPEVLVTPEYNAQNLPILEASNSPSGTPSIGGAEIVIDDSALYPEVGSGSESVTPSSFSKNNDKISTYVVQEGDTISQIAEMFSVSTNTIRWGNDIDTNDVINPGDRLVILPINGVRHTIEKGDTIKSIAKEYEGDVDEILRFNELTLDSEIAVGDVVVVPNGEVHRQTKSSSVATYSSAAVSSGSYFINPVPGSVLTQGIHGYNAVDLGAKTGTPIYAAASGEVIVSKQGGWNGGYGSYVVIKHPNGTQTLYSHLSSNSVYVGQYVTQGDGIGYVGATGRATGPHLHFEVRGDRNPLAR